MAALAALLWYPGASAALAVSTEEERLLGCDCDDTNLREHLPFTRRYSASGLVRGSLAEATTEGGVPASAMVEALDALAAGIDLERELRDGDRFYVRYELSFTAAGDFIGVGRVLWAELETQARGKLSIHRFRPRQSTGESFWLSTGESTATARIRLPLDNVLVSSGFGMRADPFQQPLSSSAPRRPAAFPVANLRAVTKPPVGAPQAGPRAASSPRAQAKLHLYRATNVNAPMPLGQKLGVVQRIPAARVYLGLQHSERDARGRRSRGRVGHDHPRRRRRGRAGRRAQGRLRQLDRDRARAGRQRARTRHGVRPPLRLCAGDCAGRSGQAGRRDWLRRLHRPLDWAAPSFRDPREWVADQPDEQPDAAPRAAAR